MERGPIGPRSSYMSSNGSTGSDISSNLFEIDVDAALREFAAARAPSATMGSTSLRDNATPASSGSDDVAGVPATVERRDNDGSDPEQPLGEAPSGESSDSDVIHIDLTQRPPPLPVSGLALADMFSMLPGSTYAVSGSGIPMRTSPRPEPRQQSPSARSGTADTGSVRPDSSQDASEEAEGHGESESLTDRDQQTTAAPHLSSGGGAPASGGGGGSPRMALTFIPGLGLVPVVIHDDVTDEDEDEADEDDVDIHGVEFQYGGMGMGAVSADARGGYSAVAGPEVTFLESDDEDLDGVAAVAAAFQATYDDDDGREDSEEGEGGGDSRLPPHSAVEADNAAGVEVGGARSTAAGNGAGADGGNSGPRGNAAGPRVNVSVEQLRDIIQEAVQGLEFGSMMFEEEEVDDDEDDGDGEQDLQTELSQQRGSSPGLLVLEEAPPVAIAATVAGFGQTPSVASAAPGQPDVLTPTAGGTAAGLGDQAGSSPAVAPSEETEDDDAYIDNEDNDAMDIADEVDDSGSGGGDEAESILGGLGQPRISFTVNSTLLTGSGQAIVAPAGSSGVQAAEGHAAKDSDPGGVTADALLAGAPAGSHDAHFMVFGQHPPTSASTHHPRPRYLSHSVARSYDLPGGIHNSDSSSAPATPTGTSQLGAFRAAVVDAGSGDPPASLALPGAARAAQLPDARSANSFGGGSSLPTPFAGSVLSTNGNGGNLNSTMRTTGQSLSAIRQAALQEEAQRQAKVMAERLGGGADKAPNVASGSGGVDRHYPSHQAETNSRAGSHTITNPFGFAGQQASAAAGLIDISSEPDGNSHHRSARRVGSSSSAGHAHGDGRHRHGSQSGVQEAEGGLEALLRDGYIIQPRYPTDAKGDHSQQHGHHHGHHNGHGDGPSKEGAGNAAADAGNANDSSRPRHRRSMELVDLDMLAAKDASADQPNSQDSSAEGNSTPAARSLLATRKFDEGHVSPPVASSSPRMNDEDDDASGSSRSSSSAESVTDERLVDEMAALREELGQKTTLVAGLRGELRKYTGLAMRLEHQLVELRNQAGEGGAAGARARIRSQSDTGACAILGIGAAAAGGMPSSERDLQQSGSPPSPPNPESPPQPAAAGLPLPPTHPTPGQSVSGAPPSTSASNGIAAHALPPHPQAQGLDALARLALYRELLSQTQLQLARSSGPMPPDLRDAQELFRAKDTLDAGTEKVMIIKMQKLVTWGCEAGWKASVAQQQVHVMEQAAQQAAQARAALEAERDQLKQTLESMRASRLPPLGAAARGLGAVGAGIASSTEEELRRKLEISQSEAKAARAEVSELESALVALHSENVTLRGQVQRSRGSASEDAVDAGASRADDRAWSMERQMLLKTIHALENSDKARDATDDAASAAGGEGSSSSGAAAPAADAEETPKAAALATAALERMQQLEDERDAAVFEVTELRRQVAEALAEPTHVQAEQQESSGASAGWNVEQLQQELSAAREAFQLRSKELQAEAALHEEQCAALRAQVAELRQEAARSAADAAAAVGRRDAEARALAAVYDARIEELQHQLLAAEIEVEDLKAEAAQPTRAAVEQPEHGLRSLSMERRVAALRFDLQQQSLEAAATVEDLQQALLSDVTERDRLQQLLDAKALELELSEAQVNDVHAAVSQLHAEASDWQAQVKELQTALARMQLERDDAQGVVAEAREQADAADERACDAHEASLLAETALGRALEEVETLRSRAASLEDDAEQAREEALVWRRRCKEGEAALLAAQTDAEAMRAHAAGLEDDARDLRTALSAEDEVQEQLRDQVECLESELEAQASLAEMSGERAAQVEAALVEAEERHSVAVATAGKTVPAQAAEEKAKAAAAQQRVAELEARVSQVDLQLMEATKRCEQAVALEADMERRLVAAVGQRERAEQRLLDATAQLEAMQHAIDELQRRQDDAVLDADRELANVARMAAVEEQLLGAEHDREALRMEVMGLHKQLAAAVQKRVEAPTQDHRQQQEALLADQVAVLRSERARALADSATLQAELDRLRAADVSHQDAEARANALQQQLQAARAEVQAVRADLQAAAVELSVKGEVLTAKERSLLNLQETVDALKVALQVTQQHSQAHAPPLKRSAGGGDVEGAGDTHMQQYRGTVAALQTKFADSEYTIRRLEKQVAALETKLTTDDGSVATQATGSSATFEGRHSPQSQQLPYGAENAIQELELQLQEKDAENSQLRRELELTRSQASASARLAAASAVGSSPSRGFATAHGNDERSVSAAMVNELQMQILQWRALGEDVHARYQSKKETVRRLREQLASEQQRHADVHARGQAQLEAACQRLGRLATELGTALRRCIALDLQPLSTTALTTSPRSLVGGSAVPDDVNALAALVARQGAALVESLELALDHVTTAREERALVTAQLAHRQAVLDELRHHLARQAGVVHMDGAATAVGASGAASGIANISSGGTWASQVPFPAGNLASARPTEMRQGLSNSTPHAAGTSLGAAGSPGPSPVKAAGADASPRAGAQTSPSKALQTAAMNLAQDMAALSVQQAGLRNTLHHFEQRGAQQGRPRSLGSATYSPGSYHNASAAAAAAAAPYPSIRTSPRGGSNVAPADAFSIAATSPVAGPHSFVGLLSGARAETLASTTGPPASAGTQSLRQAYGLYNQPASTVGAGSSRDRLRTQDALRDAAGPAPPLSPTRLHSSRGGGMSRGTSGNAAAGPAGAVGASASGMGLSSGLGLSRERRLKLAESVL